MQRRIALLLLILLLLIFGGVQLLSGDPSRESALATGCDPAASLPAEGTVSLRHVRQSSTPHLGHHDYVLSGRVRWDSQAALDCLASVDWAYEHEIAFRGDFSGRSWSIEHTFPEGSEPYIDTMVNDRDAETVLTVGVFRPDTLRAGVDYWFSFETPLRPESGRSHHSFALIGEISERICPNGGAWCVARSSSEVRDHLIPSGYEFAVDTGGCWRWSRTAVEPCRDASDALPPEPGVTEASVPRSLDELPTDLRVPADGSDPATDPVGDTDRDADTDGAAGSAAQPSPTGQGGSSTATTIAASRPPTGSTTTTPGQAGPTTTGPTTTVAGLTPTTNPTVRPPSSTTTTTPSRPSPTTTTPTPTTTSPGPTPTTRPTPPTTAPPTTSPPTPTTLPPTPTTSPPSPTTSPPSTSPPPPTTSPPPATTSPPPAALPPSIQAFSATSSRPGRLLVTASISWPPDALGVCTTYVDGAAVSVRECGRNLRVNLRGVASGTHAVQVRACNGTACTDSATVNVVVG